MPSLRRRPIRPPRPEELDLLARLVDGPLPIIEGPLGRCLKRGWCERVPSAGQALAGSPFTATHDPLYALTRSGLQALVEHGRLPDHLLDRLSDRGSGHLADHGA